ncbi:MULTISPECIES: ArsR/SmtB family transcription factor [Saccharibacillus]|uniref:ArsR/SmtB family transcription factor n=1 Tax=Saccharibacillus TaxID=456492 RepID=UPI00123BBAD4|nr:metalloregulator ArsR/SmtB family transcription factor [Saccharibacillus sp. WB 17]MWJ33921.1 metalloregulator ArsR/SmtB family transcription factor [Saccharibacillus sp. WB 17]
MWVEEMAEKLKVMGDKTRLTILILLQEREWCVCDLVDVLEMSQPAVSQHMRKLKLHGLVSEARRGQWVHYSLNVADKPYVQSVLDQVPDTAELLAALQKDPLKSCCD